MTVTWTPSNTLAGIIDGTESVKVTLKSAPTAGDNGISTFTSSTTSALTAKRLRVSIREAEASGGMIHVDDVKFHLLASGLSRDPAVNDEVLTGAMYAERWHVVKVDKILHGTRYRIYARRL